MNGYNRKAVSNVYTSLDLLAEQLEGIDPVTFTSDQVVEIDEAYFGPKQKYNRGRRVRSGFWVFGMTARESQLFYGCVVDDRTRDTLEDVIYARVEPDTTIMSDEFTSYNQLHLAFNHFTCNHSEGGQYSVNLAGLQIHTNKIEGVWSQLKTKVR
jgi:transposase-like protein